MSQLYSYTPSIWPSLLTVFLIIALTIYGWRWRSMPGALPFTIGSLLTSFWAAGSVMEVAAVSFATKISWFKFEALWQIPAATALTCFVLEFTWTGRWLTRRNLVLLSIVPLLIALLILTNNRHHLMWQAFAFERSVIPVPGTLSWFFLAYGFGLGIVNIIVFTWFFLHSPLHRWPVAIMITGQIAARAVYALDLFHAIHTGLPVDMLGIGFLVLMYAIVLFGFRIFDPVPPARQAAIEQLQAGVVALDVQGRVVGLNPFAERILGAPAGRARGKLIKDLLPAYSEEDLDAAERAETEFSLGDGLHVRNYSMAVSKLKDWRGLEIGRLLLLRDVTEQKQAQIQILEQQRALATLNERERMARELHDSLGQVLGYASFQVEAAAKLSRDGQVEAAATQLDRLGSVIRGAHADVRQYILDLRSAPSLQQPFFKVLQQYLEGFTNNYDIQTNLTVQPELGDEPFPPQVQLQVFRIIQEALSNARKHGHARQVKVSIAANGERVCITIQDDGAGFAPGDVEMASGKHFGLQFMRERSAELGGFLRVESAPGAGTRVELEVPAS